MLLRAAIAQLAAVSNDLIEFRRTERARPKVVCTKLL